MEKQKVILFIILIFIIIITAFVAFGLSNSKREDKLNDISRRNIMNEQTNEMQIDTEISKEGSENVNNQSEEIKINLIVNSKIFSATLDNNETTRELIQMFPITLNMSDLHSNEKYNYLNSNLTTNSKTPGEINAGDIKLFGNNCLVVFYESFNNSYSYTDLGRVDNVSDFVSELGNGSVNITFELAN